MISFLTLATCLLLCSNVHSMQSGKNHDPSCEDVKPQMQPRSINRQIQEEASLNITGVIKHYGYPCQEVEVTTEDGYILRLQRIPHGRYNKYETRSRPVVFLQHGLVDSAHTWVNNLPHQSLGFLLADAGYDVWLGNSRGNTYSRRHLHLSDENPEFWKFSWDEMSRYDLPASINKVLSVTGAQKIFYIGHSQGTAIAFTGFNSNPILASRIAAFIALAPVSRLAYIESPLITLIASHTNKLEQAAKKLGIGEFAASSWLSKKAAEVVCGSAQVFKVCENIIFQITGYNARNLNETRLPIYGAHTPAGTSFQNMIHYGQAYNQRKFQMFDFGKEENMKHYNQPTPPQYSVSNLTVPTAVFWGGQDLLANPSDSQWLMARLPNLVANPYFKCYNHMDFVWGMDTGTVLYPEILKVMRRYRISRF